MNKKELEKKLEMMFRRNVALIAENNELKRRLTESNKCLKCEVLLDRHEKTIH